MAEPRYFTVAEANALIPELTEIMTEIRTIRPRVAAGQRQLAKVQGAARRNGHDLPVVDVATLQAQTRQLATRLNELIEQVSALGGQVKDLDLGLVDFLSRREGRHPALLAPRRRRDRVLSRPGEWFRRPAATLTESKVHSVKSKERYRASPLWVLSRGR
ncbi:MAG TPA: DUF2203 family protein [Dehalococcoidia bacterium]|nr:DUF2203 family protein [Dehalococcoidia bacterium]